MVDETLTTGDIPTLIMLLQRKEMGFKNVKDDLGLYYLKELRKAREMKKVCLGMIIFAVKSSIGVDQVMVVFTRIYLFIYHYQLDDHRLT